MVMPYLSRIRPAESVPRLRPRPRSRFEPAPAFPVDGPAGASLRLSTPSPQGEPAEVEAEPGPDPTDRHAAGPRIAAVTVGDQQSPPAWIQDSAPGQTAGPRPRAAVRATRPVDNDPVHPHTLRGQDTAVLPALAGVPPAPPPRPAPPVQAGAPSDGTGIRPGAASGRADFSPARPGTDRGLAPAPPSATARAAVEPEHTPRNPALVPGGRVDPAGRPGAPPAPSPPPLRPPSSLAERPRHADQTRHADRADPAGQLGLSPADRIQAMARWLRDADTAPSRAGQAGPPADRRQALAGPHPDQPAAAAPPDVTVTIGRIEVKMPGPEPAPARREPGGPGRRVPSLDDYLTSRTRARGRPG
jgi:hypothetical protein